MNNPFVILFVLAVGFVLGWISREFNLQPVSFAQMYPTLDRYLYERAPDYTKLRINSSEFRDLLDEIRADHGAPAIPNPLDEDIVYYISETESLIAHRSR